MLGGKSLVGCWGYLGQIAFALESNRLCGGFPQHLSGMASASEKVLLLQQGFLEGCSQSPTQPSVA